ncbi:gluconate 2-dehydrogenase subunit 3 family protein [Salinicoccus kekensis]|uniref:Gluconate 2-dehydrogenase gamma chain n=1 Tax=Salinicoccus kekensis TaxID=714307 RepID=A0A285UQ09_9STAP|nr:gluconate 2-dehydrogenase subunit 3 family protein [Salinicoccus kekensis]SOC43488.1 gluconate 2-dehydrogenase gamma chain [Salinicoccus kekensis]
MADQEKKFSRRDFLKTSGVAAGGIVGGAMFGGVVGSLYSSQEDTQTAEPGTETESESASSDGEPLDDARTYFSRREDFETLAAATERIYPEDDNGPGAIELGAPYFIDRQCNEFWGRNAREYMMGPFDYTASATHGYQAKITRAEMLLNGVRRMRELSLEDHDDEFYNLDEDTQIGILEDFESGDVDVPGAAPGDFFNLLRSMTIQGVYADPVYGGNRDYGGWRMIQFPGPRMGWTNEIESEEFQEIEPEGLRTYQGGGM